ncbi:MAG: TetR/AcrR family transcriptional regulator [Kocuria sp.]|nr:TetR/AcrR family transcriptional regulator [Kocuria sp.]
MTETADLAPLAAHAELTDDPILRAAAHLFYRRGIGNVSIQDIRQLAGVSLKALYARYPSKESLVTAYLRSTHAGWTRSLEGSVADAVPDILNDDALEDSARTAAVAALFTWLGDWFATPDFVGCGIANTRGQRLSEEAQEVIRDHDRHVRSYMDRIGGSTEAGGSLFVLMEGAISTAAGTGDPDYAKVALRTARAALGLD